MTSDQPASTPRVGDLIETRGIHGQPARRGEIIELLGARATSTTGSGGTSSTNRSSTRPTGW